MELYREEIIFAKCFLAALYLAGIERFIFWGPEFEKKINEVEKSLENLPNDLKLLFIKAPIYGTRQRLNIALWENYPAMWYIDTSNFKEVIIKIAGRKSVAIQILDDYAPQIGLTIESFRQVAQAFTGKKFVGKDWK